jgi:chromosome segregation ATPase
VNLRKRLNLARRVYSLTMQLRGKSAELHAAHRRIDALSEGRCEDADLRAADARISDLTDQLAEAGRANRSAHDQIAGLQKQLAEYAIANVVTHRLADQHHLVSALPPALNRDRSNALRLQEANERLRGENEELRRANARLAVAVGGLEAELKKQLEGNPS